MLINPSLANKEVATGYGRIRFNEKGESNNLTPEQEEVLGKLKGFTISKPKASKVAKEEKVEEVKEKPKRSRKPKEEEAPKE